MQGWRPKRSLSLVPLPLATSAWRVLVDVHALGVGLAFVRVSLHVAPANRRVLLGAYCVRAGFKAANTLWVVLVLAVVVRDLAEESRAAGVIEVAYLPETAHIVRRDVGAVRLRKTFVLVGSPVTPACAHN